MAKAKKSKKGGPYLAAAFFCETILEDKHDSALSAIRIVDTLTLQLSPVTPADFPSETNRLPVPINALLSFKTGHSPGKHALKVIMESPSGKRQQVYEQAVDIQSAEPQGGFNLRMNTVIGVKAGGLFWMHVILDGKRVTRMPLLIKIERLAVPPSESANGKPSDSQKK